MIAFSTYSFNRAHAASYALSAYGDAYLKTYHPASFYASLLTNEDQKKINAVVREARILDVNVKPPDINKSHKGFTIAGDDLLYGLMKIKYLNNSAMEKIKKTRPYTDIDDFRERCTTNKRVKKYLEKNKALDIFGAKNDWSIKEKRITKI